ncbi:hypothetical protein Tco_1074686 [Tanacetum coccineum]
MQMRNNKHLQHLPIPLIPFISNSPPLRFSKGGGFAVHGFTDETRRGGEGFRDAVEIEDEDVEDEGGGDSDEEKVCEDEVFNCDAFAGFAVFRCGGGGEEGFFLIFFE